VRGEKDGAGQHDHHESRHAKNGPAEQQATDSSLLAIHLHSSRVMIRPGKDKPSPQVSSSCGYVESSARWCYRKPVRPTARISREAGLFPAGRDAAGSRAHPGMLLASSSRLPSQAGDKGFTLLELLIAVAIVGMLAALITTNWPHLRLITQRSTALNNMRAIGAAFHMYAGEHDGGLPKRTTGAADRWPKILSDYLDDITVYASAGDASVDRYDRNKLLSNTRNNTSYIMNGYNDVGAYQNANVEVRITQITHPSQVILLGMPKAGSTHFYMDMLEGKNGNHIDVLNLELYDNGSNYLFADGSARFIKKSDYRHQLWLVNPDFVVPGDSTATP